MGLFLFYRLRRRLEELWLLRLISSLILFPVISISILNLREKSNCLFFFSRAYLDLLEDLAPKEDM